MVPYPVLWYDTPRVRPGNHMDYSAIGQTTHVAARMEQLAPPGSTRLTAATLRLAEGFVQVTALGPVPVKGQLAPVDVFELVGAGPARTRLQAASVRGLTRFVGRDAELVALYQALEQAAAGDSQVVALVGKPGVGKSRLVYEGTLYAQLGQQEPARTALSTAINLYRAMEMTFWLPETEAALAQVEGR